MRIVGCSACIALGLGLACSTSSGPDAGPAAASDALAGGDAATCEAVVQGVIDVCGTSRKCEHLEYKKLCRSGNPAVVTGVFRCFGANMCWIPGDENTAGPCIDAAIVAVDPQASADAARLCSLCAPDSGTSGCGPLSGFTFAPWYLSSAARAMFRSCIASATTCGGVTQCGAAALNASGFQLNPTTC